MTCKEKSNLELFEDFASESRDRRLELLSDHPCNDPARLANGYFEFAFWLAGCDGYIYLRDVRDKIQEVQSANSGVYHTFADSGYRAKPIGYAIETLYPKVDTNVKCRNLRYYWRVQNDGRLYCIRGYFEDGASASGTINIDAPILYVGQSLKFSAALCSPLEETSEVIFSCRFTGLLHRKLSFQNAERDAFHGNETICYNSDMQMKPKHTNRAEIAQNLCELLHGYLSPLYEQFNYYTLDRSRVDQVLATIS